MTKFHITQDGWTATSVEEESEWPAFMEEADEGAKNHEGVETK